MFINQKVLSLMAGYIKMIDTSNLIERFLQKYRFRMVKGYLDGDVMDFGGNEGELKEFVSGDYLTVNYDHSVMDGKKFDTIVTLAVIEHIYPKDVLQIFKKFNREHLKNGGKIFLTTPTKLAKPILDFMAWIGLVGKENIAEHKHYWSKWDIYRLAEESGFIVSKHKRFQLGLNQLAILKTAS